MRKPERTAKTSAQATMLEMSLWNFDDSSIFRIQKSKIKTTKTWAALAIRQHFIDGGRETNNQTVFLMTQKECAHCNSYVMFLFHVRVSAHWVHLIFLSIIVATFEFLHCKMTSRFEIYYMQLDWITRPDCFKKNENIVDIFLCCARCRRHRLSHLVWHCNAREPIVESQKCINMQSPVDAFFQSLVHSFKLWDAVSNSIRLL